MSGERNRFGLFDAMPGNPPADDFRRSVNFYSLTGVAITRLWNGDWFYLVSATATASITFPAVGDEIGHHHIVKLASGGPVKITAATGTLDGSATHSIAEQLECRMYFSDGEQYRQIVSPVQPLIGGAGTASFSGPVTMASTLGVSGTASVGGGLSVGGNLTVAGTGRTSSTFNSGGNFTAEATAFFNNDGNFNAALVSSNPTVTVDSNDYWRFNRSTNQHLFAIAGTDALRIDAGFVFPGSDNVVTLGGPSNRWVDVYAVSGSVNTSDREEKTDIVALSEAERRVGRRLWQLVRRYRWKDAVARKGDAARYHFGIMAQDVAEAFAAEGLDGFRYGSLCRDEIIEPVMSKRVVKRQRKHKHTVERIDNDGVLRNVEVESVVTEVRGVVDESGAPVMRPVTEVDDDGRQRTVMRQMSARFPVMEDVEEEFEEMKPTGRYRLGIRYSELAMFMMASMEVL